MIWLAEAVTSPELGAFGGLVVSGLAAIKVLEKLYDQRREHRAGTNGNTSAWLRILANLVESVCELKKLNKRVLDLLERVEQRLPEKEECDAPLP